MICESFKKIVVLDLCILTCGVYVLIALDHANN